MSSGRVVVGRERGTSRLPPYRVMGARQSKKAYNYGFWLAQTGIIYDFLMRHQSPRTSQPHPSNHSLALRVLITRLSGPVPLSNHLLVSPACGWEAQLQSRGGCHLVFVLSHWTAWVWFCQWGITVLLLLIPLVIFLHFFHPFFILYIYISLDFCFILSNSFIIAIVCVLDTRMDSECYGNFIVENFVFGQIIL